MTWHGDGRGTGKEQQASGHLHESRETSKLYYDREGKRSKGGSDELWSTGLTLNIMPMYPNCRRPRDMNILLNELQVGNRHGHLKAIEGGGVGSMTAE